MQQNKDKENRIKENKTITPLISVIVPIYNVEKYIRKCLDSLRGQVLREIEVICIDDGSTDRSGRIADEYITDEGIWPRFAVFHTENRGLSAARNRGIDESRSQWLMFVDSDDWVDSEFCEIPWKAKEEYDADLVIFQSYDVKNGIVKKPRSIDIYNRILNEFEAHEYGGDGVWNKLYDKTLFETIRYPEGRVYEEIATTHKLVHKADKILFLNDRLYYHNNRKNSITHTHSEKNKKDCFISALERRTDLLSYGFPENKILPSMCSASIGYLSSTIPKENELQEKAKAVLDSVSYIPRQLTIKKKIALVAWRIDSKAFYLLSRTAGRMNGNGSSSEKSNKRSNVSV